MWRSFRVLRCAAPRRAALARLTATSAAAMNVFVTAGSRFPRRDCMHRIVRPLVLALPILIALVALAAREGRAQVVQLDYSHETLPNGLQVVVLEDHSCPIVAVQVWYHVGSKNEDPQRQGFAHMFEHMMFRGTDRLGPKGHMDLLRRVGGDCNAYTSFDQTVYINKVPSNQLELAFWLEAERMAFLKVDDESLHTERAVVEEERRLGLNRPYGTVLERVLPTVFRESPYRWSTIGQIPHLRKASIDELMRFWETYYVPNNAVLVIVGDVKADEVHALAEKYFGWIPRGEDPQRPAPEPEQSEPRSLTVTEPKGPLTLTGLIYRTVPMTHKDSAAIEVLAEVLGGGESSRLHLELVKNKETAIGAIAAPFELEQAGILGVGAAVKPFGEKDDVLAALRAQVEKIKAEPISEEELSKAKTQILKGHVASATTVESKAQLLGTYALLYKDLPRINRRADEVNAVTIADVQRVARTYLVDDRCTTAVVEPSFGEMLKNLLKSKQDEGAPTTKPAENRVAERRGSKAMAVRPAGFAAEPPLRELLSEFPQVPRVEKILANGLKVVVVPNDELPLVSMTLGIKFGAWTEDPAKPGAASMAASMITQGTENFTSDELAEELEENAITLGGGVGMDSGTVAANCMKDQSDRAVRLLAEVVRRPTFPQKDFNRTKEQLISSLSVSAQTPSYLADRELRQRVWGDHPYARAASGETADVRKLAPDDLKKWWMTYVRPDTTVLYIAGDITPQQGFELASKYFGDWKVDGPAPVPAPPETPQRQPTSITLLNKPGSVQSEIRVAQIGVTRAHPDFQTARVITQIFGGSFGSRLNESLRVQKGLTYGANGGFSASKFAGLFTISTFSKNESTSDAVRATVEEVRNLHSIPPTDEELALSKGFLVGSFAGDRETPQATIGDLWLIESNNLPNDYLQQALAGVSKAEIADVSRVAMSLVDPTKLTIVIVGDAKRVQDGLNGLAPTTVIDAPQGELSTTQPSK
jgi:zinc protease